MTRWLLLLLVVGARAQEAPEVGDLAPTFEAMTVDRDTLRLGDFRGKTVLLEFWGTWCAPCIVDAPRLADLYARTDRDEFAIIGVALDAAQDVQRFTEAHGLAWPQVAEPNRDGRKVTRLYGVRGYPTSIVIDSKGVIVYRGEGAGSDIVAVIDEHLGALD